MRPTDRCKRLAPHNPPGIEEGTLEWRPEEVLGLHQTSADAVTP